jgi:hypothetical protein
MRAPARQTVFWCGISFGIAIGVATCFTETLTSISDHRLIAIFQMIVIIPATPGLFGAAMGGSLAVGALINLAFYWILGSLICLFFKPRDNSAAW